MDDSTSTRLNRLVQGTSSLDGGLLWFTSLTARKQLEVLRELGNYAVQASARPDDVSEAIQLAALKETHTPAVLLSRSRPTGQLEKLNKLLDFDRVRAFRLLIALLSIADGRRRTTSCEAGCTHWWHNLENTAIE